MAVSAWPFELVSKLPPDAAKLSKAILLLLMPLRSFTSQDF
eukprot:CAMPEP_0197692506 /NCGR_PEP_ID=MMETSP1338-20131121/111194_1 /TAXON_ID=43686 ORGANISM="Pelagodinium beii, Strain RCC1491" /NCGR_SAMPLE_ID=MMETSP1338 /ASSEMBLY_ACC=CAM_ASM_000754 /LENGTH=40 /DNA_ID= /DNA_START= /DNA_END= /DNA_ORIENTATION=